MFASLNLLTPWIVLSVTVFLLTRVQMWIHQHLFGVGLLASKERGMATVIYLLVLMPGVFLREFSRYMVAGVFRIPPTFITLKPQVGEDGFVDIRFIHFLILNPVFAAFVGLAPFLAGLACVTLISQAVLDIPSLLAAIGSTDPNAFRDAFLGMVETPYFLMWVYILFGIANTMMPTAGEVRSTWVVWLIIAIFFGFLLVIGLHNTIFLILSGPVSSLLYALSAVFGVVLGFDLIAAVVVWLVEKIVERLTNKKIQYQPAEKPARQPKALPPAPGTVYDLKLPIPLPPGKALPAGAQTPRLAPGQPAEGRPAIPARGSGDLPPVPERAEPPAPRPASPLPGPPPPRMPAASVAADDPMGGSPTTVTPAAREPTPGEPARSAPPPLKPAAQSGGEKAPLFGPTARQPSGETGPISGPPGFPRPTVPERKTGAFPPPSDRPARPAPKPYGRPAEARAPSKMDEEDYIDADVIDEGDEGTAPGKPARPGGGIFGAPARRESGPAPKPGGPFAPIRKGDQAGEKKDGDEDELKYVNIDDA